MNLFALIYACDYILGFDNFDEEIAGLPMVFFLILYFINSGILRDFPLIILFLIRGNEVIGGYKFVFML